MKKHLTILLAIFLLTSLLPGCGSKKTAGSAQSGPVSSGKSAQSGSASSAKSVQPTGALASAAPKSAPQEGTPKVYMTTHITPDGLMAVYNALGRKATGKVAVKLTVGEPTDTYYLSPDLIKEFVLSVKGTFVDCNTVYGGQRTGTAMHLQVAKDHGFTAYTKMDIMDADGSFDIPVVGGKHLKKDIIGSHLKDYDSVVILSHFKGHEMAGFGGAIKNMSIGIAAQAGKSWIHSAGTSVQGFVLGNHKSFLESMTEAAKAVADYSGDRILYINVMNNLSIDCDCEAHPAIPQMKDIGILASLDPVALDKACEDRVYAAPDGQALIARMESLDANYTLDYGQQIGLGSEKYQLVNVDG